MSVNVNVKKIVIAVVVLLNAVVAVWWFVTTKETRAAKAEYKMLVIFAHRQAVEIAIIEQRSKLLDYQQQMAAANRPKKIAQSITSNPPMPFVPADPKDVK